MKTRNLVSIICLVITGIIFSSFKAQGQYLFPKKELCEQLKTRTLAVQLFDETNPALKPFNDAIRKAYTEEWKLTPVEFVSLQKKDELLNAGDTKYALAYPSNVVTTYTQEFIDRDTRITKFEREFNFSHFDVYLVLITSPGKSTNITSVSFINEDVLPGELFFAAEQLHLLVNAALNDRTGKAFYDAEKNIEYIKSKTFLLPAEFFKEKDLPKMAEKYEHPFKISDLKELNEVILSKNAQYVYPKIIWSNKHRVYGWITVGAEDGAVRSFMAFSGLATGTNEKANEVLKPGQLNNALNKMMQKVNNKYD